jgi:hypothetical protein
VYATDRTRSGVLQKEVSVRDSDEADMRLPVEELLLSVEAGVIVRGTAETTYWCGGLPGNGRWYGVDSELELVEHC